MSIGIEVGCKYELEGHGEVEVVSIKREVTKINPQADIEESTVHIGKHYEIPDRDINLVCTEENFEVVFVSYQRERPYGEYKEIMEAEEFWGKVKERIEGGDE